MGLAIVGLWVVGVVCGWLLVNGVLHYDGSRPVNIFSTLIILVVSQLLTLLLLIVFLLGGFNKTMQTLSVFNPAALWLGLINKISRKWSSQFSAISSLVDQQSSYRLKKYFLVYLAQHFTVALNLGIVAGLLYLVTVSDLAFGWNTTLFVESKDMVHWFQLVSLPWEQVFTSAVPSEELVETSRYYRLQGQLNNGDWHPDQLGTWWLYIFMAVVVYGLLPRLLTLIISGSRYDKEISNEINKSAGVNQILARMNSPLVSTHAAEKEINGQVVSNPPTLRKRQFNQGLDSLMITWSMDSQADGRVDPAKLTSAGIIPGKYFSAGGNQSLASDRDIMKFIAAHQPEGVAIMVKSWEPPLLDLMDFIENLRDQLDPQCPIIILLLGLNTAPVSAIDLDSWEVVLAKLDDPGLYVEAL